MDRYEFPPQSPAERPSPLQNGIVLVEHIPCERCKYDLFHSQLGGICPECGHSLRLSINYFRRRQAERAQARPGWIRLVFLLVLVAAVSVCMYLLPDLGFRLLVAGIALGVEIGWKFAVYVVEGPRRR